MGLGGRMPLPLSTGAPPENVDAGVMETIQELRLTGPDTLVVEDTTYRCTIGRGGIATAKREGDLATPTGRFPLRGGYYRPDRITPPPTALPLAALTPQDGWCDDPAHPLYNQSVKLPFAAHHETLWREDHVYDLIIPLGYNDGPITPGLGSAIFLHLMRTDGVGTEGCIAVERETLLALLPRLSVQTQMVIG
jgi:L,D-peptidoglycan transpeptidase YkuD (ErfK/YbiS/YcfS/YnhG family)